MENSTSKNNKTKLSKTLNFILILLSSVLITVSYIALFSAIWVKSKYGDIGFDAIIFTMFSDLNGTSFELVKSYLTGALLWAIIFSVSTVFILFFAKKKFTILRIKEKRIRFCPIKRGVAALLTVVLSCTLTTVSAFKVKIPDWVKSVTCDNGFFEREYVYPDNVEINFPEKKRNLIYIYLESMENTFFSKEQGGALDYNVMPELYNLAKENINFSNTDFVGGCRQTTGATWTIGATVAQSGGIPLKIPVERNSYGGYSQFLPGLKSITDILHENGYYQMFLVGSEARFGGRSNYYLQHGVDEVCDIFSAREEGIVEDNYWNDWWGMEDHYVYEYAKQKLTELASKDEPFSFITLTTDTHHVNGYTCKLCDDKYEEKYENVYACASRQASEFINWIKEQDFYENTTVIITGDHCSMDAEYMARNTPDGYVRRIYNCFINTATEPVKEKNREFSQFDMFPTTLASIGAEIKDERLGLGVNLFSSEETLAEKYGFDEFNALHSEKSNMYDKEFLFGKGN